MLTYEMLRITVPVSDGALRALEPSPAMQALAEKMADAARRKIDAQLLGTPRTDSRYSSTSIVDDLKAAMVEKARLRHDAVFRHETDTDTRGLIMTTKQPTPSRGKKPDPPPPPKKKGPKDFDEDMARRYSGTMRGVIKKGSR